MLHNWIMAAGEFHIHECHGNIRAAFRAEAVFADFSYRKQCFSFCSCHIWMYSFNHQLTILKHFCFSTAQLRTEFGATMFKHWDFDDIYWIWNLKKRNIFIVELFDWRPSNLKNLHLVCSSSFIRPGIPSGSDIHITNIFHHISLTEMFLVTRIINNTIRITHALAKLSVPRSSIIRTCLA